MNESDRTDKIRELSFDMANCAEDNLEEPAWVLFDEMQEIFTSVPEDMRADVWTDFLRRLKGRHIDFDPNLAIDNEGKIWKWRG